MERVIPALSEKYELVTVSELLNTMETGLIFPEWDEYE